MYTDRHRDRGSSRFPAFSSWSSARKRVALATVSDCPGRCTRLCQRMPWRLRRLMAGIMQTHGATYTRHTPVCHVCLKRADYSRISPDALPPLLVRIFSPGSNLSLPLLVSPSPSQRNSFSFLLLLFFFDNPNPGKNFFREWSYFFIFVRIRTKIHSLRVCYVFKRKKCDENRFSGITFVKKRIYF